VFYDTPYVWLSSYKWGAVLGVCYSQQDRELPVLCVGLLCSILDNRPLQGIGEHMLKKIISIATAALILMPGCGMIQDQIKKCLPTPEPVQVVVKVPKSSDSALTKVQQVSVITAGTFSILYILSKSAPWQNKLPWEITGIVVAVAAIVGTVGALVYDAKDTNQNGDSTDAIPRKRDESSRV
jgi:hypothetical protein